MCPYFTNYIKGKQMFSVATVCERPATSHGRFVPSQLVYFANTTVYLKCDFAYIPVSDVNTTCDECGEWNPSVPNCTAGKEVYMMWQWSVCVLGSPVVMTLARLARGRGSTPRWGTIFFWIANGHFNPLWHLVANVISRLEMHEDMLSSWRGECDSDQCVSSIV